jgi:uncharacterized lipoprotein YajG
LPDVGHDLPAHVVAQPRSSLLHSTGYLAVVASADARTNQIVASADARPNQIVASADARTNQIVTSADARTNQIVTSADAHRTRRGRP